MKLKNFCKAKNTVIWPKQQTTKWEKILLTVLLFFFFLRLRMYFNKLMLHDVSMSQKTFQIEEQEKKTQPDSQKSKGQLRVEGEAGDKTASAGASFRVSTPDTCIKLAALKPIGSSQLYPTRTRQPHPSPT